MRTLLALLLTSTLAWPRDPAIPRAFKATHPCPATHQIQPSCPGYIVDHIVPLCAGGPDELGNLAWQTVEDAAAKDKAEWALCRWIRRERGAQPR